MIERIQTKLAEIALQKEQAMAQFNALLGAEQALRQLLESEPERMEESLNEEKE